MDHIVGIKSKVVLLDNFKNGFFTKGYFFVWRVEIELFGLSVAIIEKERILIEAKGRGEFMEKTGKVVD